VARNADYDADVDNLIQGGDTMVKRVEAFKAEDGSLHETENDAKLRNLINAISTRTAYDLRSALQGAFETNRSNIIMQIEKDWVLTKPTLAV